MVVKYAISTPNWVAEKIDKLKPKDVNRSEFINEAIIKHLIALESQKGPKLSLGIVLLHLRYFMYKHNIFRNHQ